MRTQQAAQDGATHRETRAEGPKDMRSTEASYLARGLAERVESLEGALALLEAFDPPRLSDADSVTVGALVQLEDEGGVASAFLLVPVAGGERLEVEGFAYRSLTPATPLGQKLQGCSVGDVVEAPAARGRRELRIASIC